jgi:hypothetical protein
MSDDLQIHSLSTVHRLDLRVMSVIFRFEKRFPSMNPSRRSLLGYSEAIEINLAFALVARSRELSAEAYCSGPLKVSHYTPLVRGCNMQNELL